MMKDEAGKVGMGLDHIKDLHLVADVVGGH